MIISTLEEGTEKPGLRMEMQCLMRWKAWGDQSECMKTNKHVDIMSWNQLWRIVYFGVPAQPLFSEKGPLSSIR